MNANSAQYRLITSAFSDTVFTVNKFSGRDSISKCYKFTMDVHSVEQNIPSDEMINSNASFLILDDYTFVPFSGVITNFNYLKTDGDYGYYRIVIEPRVKLLSLSYQNRLFHKKTVPDIIKEVLDEYNLNDYYQLDASQSYPEREMVVQYDESDLDFISRLMNENGLWYFFKEDPIDKDDATEISYEQMIITDDVSLFEEITGNTSEIKFRSGSALFESQNSNTMESISALSSKCQLIPKSVKLKSYNYRTPEIAIMSESEISEGDIGEVYRYGTTIVDNDDADNKSRILSNGFKIKKYHIEGQGSCRRFRAGSRFTIIEHPSEQFNSGYLITELHFFGGNTAGGMSSGTAYSNFFSALDSETALDYVSEDSGKKPMMPGIFTATVESQDSDYAMIDDTGRYKVRLPFDQSDSNNSEASKYVRMSQPSAGADSGIHFPVRQGGEMVLSCINGDPNRIMGLGMVPNPNTPSPVTSENNTQNLIKTGGGNIILLDDTADKQKIQITSSAANTLLFDDENKKIAVQSTDERKLIFDDENKKINLDDGESGLSIETEDGIIKIVTAGGHVVTLNDTDKVLIIKSSDGHTVELNDDAGKITISDESGDNKFILEDGTGITLESTGEINIKAGKDLSIEAANINLKSSQGEINTEATTDINISGMNINSKADMKMISEALEVGIKATTKAVIESSIGTEISSNLQTKISGVMTEVAGDAMTTIKGGVVMVN